jgi:hydroxymethylbilane synthase
MPKIVIASRKSDLARIQAQTVADELIKIHPNLEVELSYRESLGDKNQHDPLWKMPEKGVFTQDFKTDLVAERIDVVVHSWKDLPTEMGSETMVVGALPRADQRDLLLVKKSVLAKGLKPKLVLLSSSPRRAYNLSPALTKLLPSSMGIEEIEFSDVRGNVPTRLKKCLQDEYADGLVLAKAGIDRLLLSKSDEFLETRQAVRHALQEFRWCTMPLSLNPSAAAQGALALEIKVGRNDLEALLAPLLCEQTTAHVQIERNILKSYGGGCHQKIGVSVINHPLGALVSVKGETDEGKVLNSFEVLSDFLRRERPEMAHLQDAIEGPLAWSSEAMFDARQNQIANEKSYFPKSKSDTLKVFSRQNLPTHFERLRFEPLVVARANALPEGYTSGAEQILWAAGIETWKALASRGHWLSGCSDSLGEDFLAAGPQIEALAPEQSGGFTKLSHDKSLDGSRDCSKVVATYTLSPKPDAKLPEPLPEWFYWMSGTAFKWAVSQKPEILGALHSCGPGNTLKTILEFVPQAQVRVYLNYESWLHQIEKAIKERH